MATSTAQTLPAVIVYGYLYNDDGTPAVNKQVWLRLNIPPGTPVNCTAPVVTLPPDVVYTTRTDPNGFWQVSTLVPTDRLNPANALYTRTDELGGDYQINPTLAGVPGAGWQDENIKVGAPAALAPAGQTVGPLIVAGDLSATTIHDTSLTTGQVVFPAAGGLLTGDAALFWDNVAKRLGIGTAVPGQPLDIVGNLRHTTAFKARAFAGAQVLNIVTATPTKIPLNNKTYDPNVNFDAAVNFRYTAALAGYYQINGACGMQAAATSLLVTIYKNGAAYSRGHVSTGFGAVVSDIVPLGVGDTIELWVTHSTGVNVLLDYGTTITYLSIHYLST